MAIIKKYPASSTKSLYDILTDYSQYSNFVGAITKTSNSVTMNLKNSGLAQADITFAPSSPYYSFKESGTAIYTNTYTSYCWYIDSSLNIAASGGYSSFNIYETEHYIIMLAMGGTSTSAKFLIMFKINNLLFVYNGFDYSGLAPFAFCIDDATGSYSTADIIYRSYRHYSSAFPTGKIVKTNLYAICGLSQDLILLPCTLYVVGGSTSQVIEDATGLSLLSYLNNTSNFIQTRFDF